MRVQYDIAGNVRYHWRRKFAGGDYEVATAQAHFYGADDKLRVSQKYSYTGADQKNRGSYEEYWYDALGRRVMVRTRTDDMTLCNAVECDPGVERIIWDGDQVLVELRADNTTNAYTTGSAYYGRVLYTPGGGIDQPLSVLKDTTVLLPYVNWRGLFAGGQGMNGQPCATSTGGWCSNIQFPGEKWGAYLNEREPAPPRPFWWGSVLRSSADGSGLLYRRNRYYDPTTGQFTQEDPIGIAGGLNVYGYADGDPLGLSDPIGLCIWDACVAEGAIVAGLFVGSAYLTAQVSSNPGRTSQLLEAGGNAVNSTWEKVKRWIRAIGLAGSLVSPGNEPPTPVDPTPTDPPAPIVKPAPRPTPTDTIRGGRGDLK